MCPLSALGISLQDCLEVCKLDQLNGDRSVLLLDHLGQSGTRMRRGQTDHGLQATSCDGLSSSIALGVIWSSTESEIKERKIYINLKFKQTYFSMDEYNFFVRSYQQFYVFTLAEPGFSASNHLV